MAKLNITRGELKGIINTIDIAKNSLQNAITNLEKSNEYLDSSNLNKYKSSCSSSISNLITTYSNCKNSGSLNTLEDNMDQVFTAFTVGTEELENVVNELYKTSTEDIKSISTSNSTSNISNSTSIYESDIDESDNSNDTRANEYLNKSSILSLEETAKEKNNVMSKQDYILSVAKDLGNSKISQEEYNSISSDWDKSYDKYVKESLGFPTYDAWKENVSQSGYIKDNVSSEEYTKAVNDSYDKAYSDFLIENNGVLKTDSVTTNNNSLSSVHDNSITIDSIISADTKEPSLANAATIATATTAGIAATSVSSPTSTTSSGGSTSTSSSGYSGSSYSGGSSSTSYSSSSYSSGSTTSSSYSSGSSTSSSTTSSSTSTSSSSTGTSSSTTTTETTKDDEEETKPSTEETKDNNTSTEKETIKQEKTEEKDNIQKEEIKTPESKVVNIGPEYIEKEVVTVTPQVISQASTNANVSSTQVQTKEPTYTFTVKDPIVTNAAVEHGFTPDSSTSDVQVTPSVNVQENTSASNTIGLSNSTNTANVDFASLGIGAASIGMMASTIKKEDKDEDRYRANSNVNQNSTKN